MNGSKTVLLSIASAVSLALVLPGAAGAAKEPLKIGVPTALTGTYSALGDEAKRAVEFAVNEANAAGGADGRKVEVRFLDTEAKPELARQQAEKLALEGFNIMTATIASGEVLAVPMAVRAPRERLGDDRSLPIVFTVAATAEEAHSTRADSRFLGPGPVR